MAAILSNLSQADLDIIMASYVAHDGLVMPYGIIEYGQHWWYQAITYIYANL